jgi:hypothetical protein
MKSSFYLGTFSLVAAILAMVSLQAEAGNPKKVAYSRNAKAVSRNPGGTTAKKVVYSGNTKAVGGNPAGATAKKVVYSDNAKAVIGNTSTADGISRLIQVAPLKSANANEEALAGADTQRDLVPQQRILRARQTSPWTTKKKD